MTNVPPTLLAAAKSRFQGDIGQVLLVCICSRSIAFTRSPSAYGKREFWQRRTGRAITEEDIRQMGENVCGFFHILDEWDRAESGK